MNWFRNLKTINKIMLCSGLLCLAMGFVGYWGVRGMEAEYTMLDDLYQKHALGLSSMREANVAMVEASRAVRNAILDDNVDDINRRFEEVRKARERFRDEFTAAEKTVVLDTSRRTMAEIDSLVTTLVPKQDLIMEMARAGKDKEAKAGLKDIRKLADDIDTRLDELSTSKMHLMQQAAKDAESAFQRARISMLTVIGVAVILGFALSIYVGRLVANPLHATVSVLQAVAGGDFLQKLDLKSTDEVGLMANALNDTVDHMRTALLEVRQSAENVAASSEQLASASQQLAAGSQQQASSLEETAASLEEITSTVKQNADHSRQANQLAAGARDAAERGGHVVSEAVTAMGEINASSKRIAEIITAIDEIAFQTNLLALNAAVEAARAGEQGRGFAVVAAEVRNLAQRSATAAKEIKSLIQDSVRKVENGSVLVNQSGQTLNEIVIAVKRVTDIVAEITAASQEQSTGIEQVNKAMTQMDQVTQSNSAQTEELSSTAQSLSSQAQQLQAMANRFQLEAGSGPVHKAHRAASHPGSKPATRSLARLARRTAEEPQPVAVSKAVGHDGFEEF